MQTENKGTAVLSAIVPALVDDGFNLQMCGRSMFEHADCTKASQNRRSDNSLTASTVVL